VQRAIYRQSLTCAKRGNPFDDATLRRVRLAMTSLLQLQRCRSTSTCDTEVSHLNPDATHPPAATD
jgi:hypothetical protein